MSDDERRNEIEQAAAEWVVRQSGAPLSAQEQAAFDAWYAADPDHAAAYERLRAAWTELDALKEAPGPLRDGVSPPRSKGPPKAAVAAALLVSGVLATLYSVGDPWIALQADYRTGPSEIRNLRLPDGSSVDLGAASAITLDFDAGMRRVRLLAGEALFTVLPVGDGDSRAFVVAAEGGTTTALGTRFVVEDRGRGVTVTAVENRVEVAAGTAQSDAHVVLSPGDAVSYESARLDVVARVNTADALAWRRGMLVFDRLQLRDVVARLNRYRRGRIVVVGDTLAKRRISGVFRADDLGQSVNTLASELGARVLALPFLTVIY